MVPYHTKNASVSGPKGTLTSHKGLLYGNKGPYQTTMSMKAPYYQVIGVLDRATRVPCWATGAP